MEKERERERGNQFLLERTNECVVVFRTRLNLQYASSVGVSVSDDPAALARRAASRSAERRAPRPQPAVLALPEPPEAPPLPPLPPMMSLSLLLPMVSLYLLWEMVGVGGGGGLWARSASRRLVFYFFYFF